MLGWPLSVSIRVVFGALLGLGGLALTSIVEILSFFCFVIVITWLIIELIGRRSI
jgi:hypothetical protein